MIWLIVHNWAGKALIHRRSHNRAAHVVDHTIRYFGPYGRTGRRAWVPRWAGSVIGSPSLDQVMRFPHRELAQIAGNGAIRQAFLYLDVHIAGALAARTAVQRYLRANKAVRRIDFVCALANKPLHIVGIHVSLGAQCRRRRKARRVFSTKEPQGIPAVPLDMLPPQSQRCRGDRDPV